MNDLSHDEVQELLAALADGELNVDGRKEVEAHLSGCGRCRAALSVQQHLRARLAAGALPQASSALVERIRSRLPEPTKARGVRRPGLRSATAWAGWAVAAALACVLAFGKLPRGAAPRPPMVVAALADYRGHAGRELPAPVDLAALRASLPFGSEPLTAGGARLVSAWKTTLRGEPASVFAYRVGDRVVLAYVVSESLFFRQPIVRETVAREGRYVTSEGEQSVVAWPRKGSGVLLVGDATAAELEALRT